MAEGGRGGGRRGGGFRGGRGGGRERRGKRRIWRRSEFFGHQRKVLVSYINKHFKDNKSLCSTVKHAGQASKQLIVFVGSRVGNSLDERVRVKKSVKNKFK